VSEGRISSWIAAMTPMSEAEGLSLGGAQVARRHMLARAYLVSAAIWALLASIFLLDVLTPPDNISACFAYAIPIFVSLFEVRPRPVLYAVTATALSLVGSFIQPPSDASMVVIIANRLIAIITQWLVAALVGLQQRRLADMRDKAEFQRRFVDILSHEVGTALTTVTGQAYRLTKLAEQLAPGDLRLRAEKIRMAAERIEAIIDRVQLASSLGDGTIPIGHGSIDLHTMLRQLTEQLKEEQRSGSIELNLCPEPQVVTGDEMLLRQMLENVIMNSIKYSPADASILVSITKHGSASRITIADRGSGIPHYEMARVRIPYYRGENSKGTSGAGLGLYVVERIVEAHRGRFSIESKVGGGTTVIIDLPQTVGSAAA
jgi:signal transduction histidine kinase